MFDWNDEELTDIIWGEAENADDHIVPYSDVSEVYGKKEWDKEAEGTKSTEQKTQRMAVDINGKNPERHSNRDLGKGTSTSGIDMDSWPDLSLSNASKTAQDSLDTLVPDSLSDISKFDSSGVETVQLDKSTGILQNSDEGKVQGDFVDYGWASIGSFDDLDRIFSNEDPIFGNANLGNTDELWSSSNDATNSSVKPFPLSLSSSREYAKVDDQLFSSGYGKVNDPASQGIDDAHAILDQTEYTGDKCKPIVKEEQIDFTMLVKHTATNSQLPAENIAVANTSAAKVYKPKKLMTGRKKFKGKRDLKIHHDFCGNWSPSGVLPGQLKSQFAFPPVQSSPTPIVSHHKQLQGPEELYYQQICNPSVATAAYENATNPFSSMPVLSHIQSGEFKYLPLLSGHDVSSSNANSKKKMADSGKSHRMTPQEKIEKLRRRQQIQAMLAIKEQQQQFVHQLSCSDQSITQKSSHEDQIQNVKGIDTEVEDLDSVPLNPNLPTVQDDSNTTSLAVGNNSMGTILYRLQDIISKLDLRTRICIRDSLFRLAQSAIQRHYASNTCSTYNSGRAEEIVLKGKIGGQPRNANIPEAETETNPVDRTVAHLLFHRPLDLSGKPPDTPESPVSIKLPHDRKICMVRSRTGSLPETLNTNKRIFHHQGSKSFSVFAVPEHVGQGRKDLPLDSSDDASNNGTAEEEGRGIEASQ